MFGDANDAQYSRFRAAAGIFESLFAEQYTAITGTDLALQTAFPVTIAGARPEDLDANGQYVLNADVSALCIRALPQTAAEYRANAGAIRAEVDWVDSPTAPIAAGTRLGTVRYVLGEKTIYSFPLIAHTDILEAAIVQPTETAPGTEPTASAGSLLTMPSAAAENTPRPNEGGGASILLYVLIALIAIVLIFIILVLIVRARKRAAAKRRRRARLEQQRRMRAQQQQRQRYDDRYDPYRRR